MWCDEHTPKWDKRCDDCNRAAVVSMLAMFTEVDQIAVEVGRDRIGDCVRVYMATVDAATALVLSVDEAKKIAAVLVAATKVPALN